MLSRLKTKQIKVLLSMGLMRSIGQRAAKQVLVAMWLCFDNRDDDGDVCRWQRHIEVREDASGLRVRLLLREISRVLGLTIWFDCERWLMR